MTEAVSKCLAQASSDFVAHLPLSQGSKYKTVKEIIKVIAAFIHGEIAFDDPSIVQYAWELAKFLISRLGIAWTAVASAVEFGVCMFQELW